jgi:hypothetical protein
MGERGREGEKEEAGGGGRGAGGERARVAHRRAGGMKDEKGLG